MTQMQFNQVIRDVCYKEIVKINKTLQVSIKEYPCLCLHISSNADNTFLNSKITLVIIIFLTPLPTWH